MPRFSTDGNRRKSPFSFLRVLLEIPVIVLSIYIAFLVDSWSTRKGEAELEKKYLQELLDEARINRDELRADQDGRNRQLKLLDKLLETGSRTVAADTLHMALDQLLMVRLYSPTDAVYQDLVSSGNLRLISSGSLRHKILQYRRMLSRVPVTEQSDIDLIEQRIEPYLISKQVLSLLEPHYDAKEINISDQQRDRVIRKLLNDRTFIDLVYLRRHRVRHVIYFETPMQWHLRDIINLIQEQLEEIETEE